MIPRNLSCTCGGDRNEVVATVAALLRHSEPHAGDCNDPDVRGWTGQEPLHALLDLDEPEPAVEYDDDEDPFDDDDECDCEAEPAGMRPR